MQWRLLTPVHSFVNRAGCRYASSSLNSAKPLRILFCGSDDFSIASLRALSKAQRQTPDLIESLQVAHRPPKLTGRGLKILREVPISKVATELNLKTHEIDTFTGWAPPNPIDLVIAVSFGLFVPPRILNLATYGGLNVHPSLLPDLRGPAPIQHALLKGRKYTGVSIQTLHPKHFDQGIILAQTLAPGIKIPSDATAASLVTSLGDKGAEMLVEVLKSRTFVPPLKDIGWYKDSGGPIEHAEKVLKTHRQVDFSKMNLPNALAVKRVLGDPWCILPTGDRLIMNEIRKSEFPINREGKKGIWFPEGSDVPVARMACGGVLAIEKCTYEGGKTGHGNARLIRALEDSPYTN